MEKVIKKFKSFHEQESYEAEYWKTIDPDVKVAILESIRSSHMEISGEGQQGLQRILRIVKRA